VVVIVLVVGAIALGNAAFEMGNIMGAAIGLELLTGAPSRACALARISHHTKL
jgi:Mn2+/Fe2+ NRAMP family transporter